MSTNKALEALDTLTDEVEADARVTKQERKGFAMHVRALRRNLAIVSARKASA
jgi:hypothetical protein